VVVEALVPWSVNSLAALLSAQ